MDNISEYFNNEKILDFFRIHDYWQLFSSNMIININNYFEIYNSKGIKYNSIEKKEEDMKKLIIGSIITCVKYEEKSSFIIDFDNMTTLKVYMEDDYYTSPEAVEVYSKDRNFILIV